jgi:aspartate aminotransferase
MKKIENPSFFIGKNSEDLISFGSGEPDLLPIKFSNKIIFNSNNFKYGSVQGELKLREILSRQYPNSKAEDFIITNGASEAIDLSLRAIYLPKGKILTPKPFYYSYREIIKLSHMSVRYYDLKNGKIDYTNLEKEIKGCLAILINSPGNPTGTIQDISTLKKIEKLAKENNIYIISDEVYKNFNYTRENYLIKGNKVLTINSFSKNFNMCGHRVGYIYARNKDLIKRIVEIKSYTSMNTNIMAQEIACIACNVGISKIRKQTKMMENRGLYMYKKLAEFGLEVSKPEGAFYLFPKMKNPSKVVSDLYYKYGVIVYDGAWFGDKERVRFSFAIKEEKMKEGLKRLKEYLNKEYLNN